MAAVFVTGGAGYVGSVLVPRLLAAGHRVTVLDLLLYGCRLPEDEQLRVVRGDIRDDRLLAALLPGQDAVIHLAAVSNDPQYELDPKIGAAVNWAALPPLVTLCVRHGISRFVYASSCSVYGRADDGQLVDESTAAAPQTDYARFKLVCERYLLETPTPGLAKVILRPGTVCGPSPRQRLDLLVNRMITTAYHHGEIHVRGPSCVRPGVHIDDLAELYSQLVISPTVELDGRIYNAAFENRTTEELAEFARSTVGSHVRVQPASSVDGRSYRVSSRALGEALGFYPRKAAAMAMAELCEAFRSGALPNADSSPEYYNLEIQRRHVWSDPETSGRPGERSR